MKRKGTKRHVFLRMVGEVKMSRDLFKASLSLISTSLRCSRKRTICNSSLRSGNFVRVGDERTSSIYVLCARTFECVGLMIGFECTFD